MNTVVMYHSPCFDGFTAAWVAKKALDLLPEQVTYHPINYGDKPPLDLIDSQTQVVLVDFSFPLEVMKQIIDKAAHTLVLDHHQSAQQALEPLVGYAGCTIQFDMNRSGAGLAWDWYHPGVARPPLVAYVEDRDLWRFKLQDSREINAVIMSYEPTHERWNLMDKYLTKDLKLKGKGFWYAEGSAILRKQQQDIDAIIRCARTTMVIGGQRVPVVNAPITLCSEIGNQLARGEGFAATYYDDDEWRRFSLRSSQDGADVAEVAKIYGGGGHKHASGFRMPLGWTGDSRRGAA